MKKSSVICIGSALWDTIARAKAPLHPGADVPGHISRQMGGVALNVALSLADKGVSVAILSAVGNDPDGDSLLAAAEARGVDCSLVTRGDFPTDNYMAVESPNGEVFAAVADCHSLEHLGADILAPLEDGRLANPDMPYTQTIIVDGNLSEKTLATFAQRKLGAAGFLIFVPASPGKAERLRDSLKSCGGTLFANRIEAELLCKTTFENSTDAACGIRSLGANAIVTDSAKMATWVEGENILSAIPPDVKVTSVTGAGDAFLAGFICSNLSSHASSECLQAAIDTAAKHISRDIT